MRCCGAREGRGTRVPVEFEFCHPVTTLHANDSSWCAWRERNQTEWQSLHHQSTLLFFPSLITPSNPLLSTLHCTSLWSSSSSPHPPNTLIPCLIRSIHQSFFNSRASSVDPDSSTFSSWIVLNAFCFTLLLLCAVQYQLSVSVTSYSKLYTSVHSSVLSTHTHCSQVQAEIYVWT